MANKVLIVDDAAFMRMMIKDILEKNGFWCNWRSKQWISGSRSL